MPTPEQCWRCGAFVSRETSDAYWAINGDYFEPSDPDGPECPPGKGCGAAEHEEAANADR